MPLITTQSAKGYGWGSLVAPVSNNSYESISTITVGSGGASAVTFTSIPQTYKHLQVRSIARASAAGTYNTYFQVGNGTIDTSNNYSFHLIAGAGGTPTAYGQSSSGNNLILLNGISNNSNADVYGTGVVDILDYTNTNKNKTIRNHGGNDGNGVGAVGLYSGAWYSTSAITTITFFTGGTNLAEDSTFALYGIKG
jgi:hypothetical protein